ncbi:MAG: HAMP domain-containing histidine kinase [Bacteroidales bacterium]|nr:HAMP domain-containing histidine kinase [Bacteroidales bacterium]MCF8403361.1 HAMP domain-containing histidine kinase [Bacteroidales bacterium]
MAISLTGIIFVQYFWIRNAIEVKEKQFDQAANLAVENAARLLSRDQNVKIVSNSYFYSDKYVSHNNDSVVWVTSDEDTDEHSFVYVGSGDQSTHNISISGKNASTIITVDELADTNIRYRTVVKLDSLKNQIHKNQMYILSEFKDSVDLIVEKKISQLALGTANLNDVIDEMVVEIEQFDKFEREGFEQETVQTRLSEALLDKGIDVAFEFAINNTKNDSLLLRSDNFRPDIKPEYSARLFPDRIFSDPDLLIVSFPGKTSHIIQSMTLLMSGSLLFTLVIILTFFITVRIILRQKKLSEIKSDFINNMTHEFKTPIATISLAVDSINNHTVINNPEKIRYFTNVIGEENTRMNSRVESVLQMSMIDKNDFNLQPQLIDIHEVLQQSYKNIELQFTQKEADVKLQLECTDPFLVADKMHLVSIFTNLLDNALKYSAEDPFIKIKATNNSKSISIKISDNGIGMSKEEQNKIFDKFYRIPKGDIHNVKGFGLGLSYVKAIIETMQGEIIVKSQPSKGSTFRIILPKNLRHKDGS